MKTIKSVNCVCKHVQISCACVCSKTQFRLKIRTCFSYKMLSIKMFSTKFGTKELKTPRIESMNSRAHTHTPVLVDNTTHKNQIFTVSFGYFLYPRAQTKPLHMCYSRCVCVCFKININVKQIQINM
jgi:hypothetical protein